jgi:hypothetical protein
MSFRHTYTTEYLYKNNREDEIKNIEELLKEYGTATWQGNRTRGYGYFHGVIKDLDGHTVKNIESKILVKRLKKLKVKIKIVYE